MNTFNIAGMIDDADDFDFAAHDLHENGRTPGDNLGEINTANAAIWLDVNEYSQVCFNGTVQANDSDGAEDTLGSILKCEITVMCLDAIEYVEGGDEYLPMGAWVR